MDTPDHRSPGAERRADGLPFNGPALVPGRNGTGNARALAEFAAELVEREQRLRMREQELEETLRTSQMIPLRYRQLFEFGPDGYLITDGWGVIEDANQVAAGLLYTRKEMIHGKPLLFLVAPERRQALIALLANLRQTHDVRAFRECEVRIKGPHGAFRDVALTVVGISGGEERPTVFRWLIHDITAQRKVESALRVERDFSTRLLETAPIVVLVLNSHGKILRSNTYMYQLTGYSEAELLQRDWSILLGNAPDTGRALLLDLTRGIQQTTILPLVARDGRHIDVAWMGQALTIEAGLAAYLMLGHDITELQEAQQRVLQAERLATIGRVATALTHECRNALQRSQACLSMLNYRVQDRPEALELLNRLEQAQDDLARLFDNVRGYAAPLRLQPRLANLGDIWRKAWADLEVQRQGRFTELREETAAVDLRCAVDPFQIKQVFRNLLENALHASGDNALIRIGAAEARLQGRPAVQVRVCDNGPGFTAEQRRCAFEAFYSTKLQGTGLGLAICQRIVEGHGGRIAVAETTGPGAEILINLPRSQS